MNRFRPRRPSPALAISLVALFVALGGGAYAATQLPKDSVGTRQLKKNAVVSSKVKNGSLLRRGFKAGQLPRGPKGDQGPKGNQGPTGPLTTTLPSGETLRGEFKLDQYVPATGSIVNTAISFGGYTLATAPTPEAVDLGGPPTADCPGSAASPAAARGKLCFYLTVRSSVATTDPYNLGPGMTAEDAMTGTDGKADPFGAQLYAQSTGAGRAEIDGTWAVTAA